MLIELFFILVIIGLISVAVPPLGIIMIQFLSMPVKLVFTNIRITGPLLAVLIILLALGIINL